MTRTSRIESVRDSGADARRSGGVRRDSCGGRAPLRASSGEKKQEAPKVVQGPILGRFWDLLGRILKLLGRICAKYFEVYFFK